MLTGMEKQFTIPPSLDAGRTTDKRGREKICVLFFPAPAHGETMETYVGQAGAWSAMAAGLRVGGDICSLAGVPSCTF